MKNYVIVAIFAVSLLRAGPSWAVTDSKNLTINATVSATAKLDLSPTTISFANADPDTTPSIPSTPATVAFTCKVKTGSSSTATLTVQTTDLTSGSDTIPITNVTWTGSGGGFVAGPTAMNSTTPLNVASWTGSGNRSGTCAYFLANSWDYASGSYSATATYVLTAP